MLYFVFRELSKSQDTIFQALQRTDELDCELKLLRDENTPLRVENTLL